MGTIIKSRLPCKSCGSSDAVVRYEDLGEYCHKCLTHDNSNKNTNNASNEGNTGYAKEEGRGFMDTSKKDFTFYYERSEFKSIPERGLDADTCKKFGVKVNDRGHHLFPAYSKEGELVAVKVRLFPEKDFRIVGDIKAAVPFGMDKFSKTGRNLTITEGEYDAMAAYRMTGSKYPHISMWTGANGAIKEIKNSFEEIREFDNIILNYDSDKAGTEAIEAIGPMFAGKAKVLQLTEGKDANEYLINNKGSKYVNEFHRAKMFTLGGLVNGADTWEAYKEKKEVKSIPFDSQYEKLNSMTYGIRFGEIILVTAGTGSGKTQVLREWKYNLMRNTEYNILDMSLEEGTGDTVGGLMALHCNKRIMLPDVHIDEEEEKKLHDDLFSDNRFVLLDHAGAVGDDSLLDKMEYAAVVNNCKIQFLDHITIAVSDCEVGQENMSMDKFMNRLLKLVKRLDICVVVVSHLRKSGGGGKSFEEGRVPTEDDLKGSGSLKQIAMTTLAISRNKYASSETERNTTQFHVLKCRYTGRTGPADFSFFDDDTGRMNVVDPDTFFEEAQSFSAVPGSY